MFFIGKSFKHELFGGVGTADQLDHDINIIVIEDFVGVGGKHIAADTDVAGSVDINISHFCQVKIYSCASGNKPAVGEDFPDYSGANGAESDQTNIYLFHLAFLFGCYRSVWFNLSSPHFI